MTPGQRLFDLLSTELPYETGWHQQDALGRDAYEQAAATIRTEALADEEAMHADGWIRMSDAERMAHIPYYEETRLPVAMSDGVPGYMRVKAKGVVSTSPVALVLMMRELRDGGDLDDLLQAEINKHGEKYKQTLRLRKD